MSKASTQESLKELRSNFWADLKTVFTAPPDPERPITRAIFITGAISFLAALGAMIGFRVAYNRLLKNQHDTPSFAGKPRAVYVAMIAFGIAGLLLPIVFLIVVALAKDFIQTLWPLMLWVSINLLLTFLGFWSMRKWQSGIYNYLAELSRHGTAHFIPDEHLRHYREAKEGIYIGGGCYYNKSGHLLTTAGTRAGKGIYLLLANLLKTGGFKGSWVVVDPKGENAAVSADYQRSLGKKVVMLNPWDLLHLGNTSFNPLDLLKIDRLNLSDDVQMIAEGIVPTAAGGDTDHFNNRARSIIAALLLHLVTSQPEEKRHLGTLWQWLRMGPEQWDQLLVDMSKNGNLDAGEIVQAAAYEILSLMEKGAREFASIMSTAQKWTDFLKSPALRESLQNTRDFVSADLSDGNTVVYIIIPADRLKTHYQWLRLVVTSLMRSVIRNPKNEVCFMLDEFYALGYLSEIEIGLGAYAGYGVHIWAVLQNLVQLRDQYGNNWENFISSCSVRHFFNVSDNTTAEYVSKMFGTYSVPTYGSMGEVSGASARNLVNPDELRRQSEEFIYTVIDQLAPARFYKWPYFKMGMIEGVDYNPNPYYKK